MKAPFVWALCALSAFSAAASVFPFDSLVPRPVSVSVSLGEVAPERLARPRIRRAPIPGAPAETADQAYRLTLAPEGVEIVAPSPRALRYAKTTLEQLRRLAGEEASLPCGVVEDWPRYPWRGWMIDTARNFVALDDLKAVIDQMAAAKLNLFHWHLTEYYGWRLESRRYPALQRKEAFYLRDIGKYYTQEDFRALVAYAAERAVTVMPEFDVPGHALAFRRAFGFRTMRDPGIRDILAGLIDELCSLASAETMPFIHLGTDEARLPEEKVPPQWMQPLVDRVLSHGRTIVGWVPGELKNCRLGDRSAAMLWASPTPEELAQTPTGAAFDGGACYVEQYDPFELPAIATYRRTCDWDPSVRRPLGPIACCWHDEYAGGSRFVIRNQLMMPAIVMLGDTFWCGRDGDEKGFYRRLPLADDPRLLPAIDLERRVALYRDRVYRNRVHPFQFLRQTDLRWRVSVDGEVVATNVAQATVYLWHHRFSRVAGSGEAMGAHGGNFTKKRKGVAVLETWIHSPTAQRIGAWIGFTAFDRDHGRAYSGGTPPPGEWGRFRPTVEVNGVRLPPPALRSAGQKPGADVEHLLYVHELDEVAYTDEEYYMRPPTPLTLKAGWNHVMLTAPCETCGNHAPWAATFIPLAGTTERPREVSNLRYRASPPQEGGSL